MFFLNPNQSVVPQYYDFAGDSLQAVGEVLGNDGRGFADTGTLGCKDLGESEVQWTNEKW